MERNPELVGALYPFSLIEGGDFGIPSVYCMVVVGEEIASKTGEMFQALFDPFFSLPVQ